MRLGPINTVQYDPFIERWIDLIEGAAHVHKVKHEKFIILRTDRNFTGYYYNKDGTVTTYKSRSRRLVKKVCSRKCDPNVIVYPSGVPNLEENIGEVEVTFKFVPINTDKSYTFHFGLPVTESSDESICDGHG
jgi:hypothetical protein